MWKLSEPPRLPLVSASILSADFAHMGRDAGDVLEAGADMLHVDVMDGHFVPNLTMGSAMVEALRKSLPDAFLDVHLMVSDPGQYVEAFAQAGANHITFNIEPALDRHAGSGKSPLSEGFDPAALMDEIRQHGASAGFAINPGTPVEAVEQWIGGADMVLVMSVEPGFSGQAFKEEVLPKVRLVHSKLSGGQRLQMDGGVSPTTAGACREAGCDCLVSASAIFGQNRGQWADVIAQLIGS